MDVADFFATNIDKISDDNAKMEILKFYEKSYSPLPSIKMAELHLIKNDLNKAINELDNALVQISYEINNHKGYDKYINDINMLKKDIDAVSKGVKKNTDIVVLITINDALRTMPH